MARKLNDFDNNCAEHYCPQGFLEPFLGEKKIKKIDPPQKKLDPPPRENGLKNNKPIAILHFLGLKSDFDNIKLIF